MVISVLKLTNSIDDFIGRLNAWGRNKVPFVFLFDYKMEKPLAWKLEEINAAKVQFNLNGFTNQLKSDVPDFSPEFYFHKSPIPFAAYEPRFEHVIRNIRAGNSFLLNLSVPTPVETNLSLLEIFENSQAPYRFWLKDQFVCFSPEIFVKISGNRISSFPMKGTIDASVENAEQVILADYKEAAEHATIVDLIRNDLSTVAQKVWVERYRYLDKVQTHNSALLQVSSEVAGILPDDFNGNYGDLLLKLLPAGSITGAPKPSTLKIIEEAEGYDRGYYTGVMGYFDGRNFESAVMIRFIEDQNGRFVFKSGGGITALSNAKSEYQELIDKVYLPFKSVPHVVY
ncbi:aminodeoxychorismate synthase component I [Dyadobacter sp.]|uniref:aminodeoxychorismate synthase component I n=1 Tax=Dyadobacter sp. TaxID=1914288 RepID=UPI003F6ED28D